MDKMKNQYIWEQVVFARTKAELEKAMILLTLNSSALPYKQYMAIQNAITVKMQAA